MGKLGEDRDVVGPFIERLLQRLRERHPGVDLTLDDITVTVEVSLGGPGGLGALSASNRLRRMLSDMNKEGVVL